MQTKIAKNVTIIMLFCSRGRGAAQSAKDLDVRSMAGSERRKESLAGV